MPEILIKRYNDKSAHIPDGHLFSDKDGDIYIRMANDKVVRIHSPAGAVPFIIGECSDSLGSEYGPYTDLGRLIVKP